MLTEIQQVLDCLEQVAFASMMGDVEMITFYDEEFGHLSFTAVGGLVLPYNGFLAQVTGHLFNIDPYDGMSWELKNHLTHTVTVWSKMKLPHTMVQRLANKTAPGHLVMLAVKSLILDHCSNPDPDQRPALVGALIDKIENRYLESLQAPIDVEGLSRLFDVVREPWIENPDDVSTIEVVKQKLTDLASF